jgi:hypothetical protein
MILDEYSKSVPSAQSTIDIFKGEWSSKLPNIEGQVITSGFADLFQDSRITLMNENFSLNGKKILELGPLEGAHTHMMAGYGASSITGVESNSRAYLKCLVVKELYELHQVNFLFGDAISYMNSCTQYYDICLASGILYHSPNPGKFIESISQISDRVFIWTHFYDESAVKSNPEVHRKFKTTSKAESKGHTFDLHKYEYGDALTWQGFCGGSENFTTWITKTDMLELLNLCGFKHQHILYEDYTHPHGPNICLYAEK